MPVLIAIIENLIGVITGFNRDNRIRILPFLKSLRSLLIEVQIVIVNWKIIL
jgi:hypothetical protein